MKTKREEFIDNESNQLKEWSSKTDELESMIGEAKADVKLACQQSIRDLKEKREVLSQKLGELRESRGEARELMKRGVESAWQEQKDAVSSVRDKFKKAA